MVKNKLSSFVLSNILTYFAHLFYNINIVIVKNNSLWYNIYKYVLDFGEMAGSTVVNEDISHNLFSGDGIWVVLLKRKKEVNKGERRC